MTRGKDQNDFWKRVRYWSMSFSHKDEELAHCLIGTVTNMTSVVRCTAKTSGSRVECKSLQPPPAPRPPSHTHFEWKIVNLLDVMDECLSCSKITIEKSTEE